MAWIVSRSRETGWYVYQIPSDRGFATLEAARRRAANLNGQESDGARQSLEDARERVRRKSKWPVLAADVRVERLKERRCSP